MIIIKDQGVLINLPFSARCTYYICDKNGNQSYEITLASILNAKTQVDNHNQAITGQILLTFDALAKTANGLTAFILGQKVLPVVGIRLHGTPEMRNQVSRIESYLQWPMLTGWRPVGVQKYNSPALFTQQEHFSENIPSVLKLNQSADVRIHTGKYNISTSKYFLGIIFIKNTKS